MVSRHSTIALDADDDEDEAEEEDGVEEAKRGIHKPQPHRDSSSLVAKAIRASSAYRDTSLSSAYGHSSRSPNPTPASPSRSPSVSLQVLFFPLLSSPLFYIARHAEVLERNWIWFLCVIFLDALICLANNEDLVLPLHSYKS